MSRSEKKKQRKTERAAPREGKAPDSATSGKASRLRAKRPVLWFVGMLVMLMGAFNALFYTYLSDTPLFHDYLALNAHTTAAILGFFGDHVTVKGDALISGNFLLGIRRGCDAIQATAFFVFLVLASPSQMRYLARIPYVIAGIIFLLLLNLFRIITLYYSGMYSSKAIFDFLHVDLWQAIFIFLPLFLWVMWTRRAERSSAKKPK